MAVQEEKGGKGMKYKISMYKRFERFWHWLQTGLIIVLSITGFELHGEYRLFGYQSAHALHIQAAWSLLALSAFAIFWHLTTGEWRQYVPTLKNFDRILHHYLVGIFLGMPHPYKKTPEEKLNPLQRLSYLFLKLIILPVLIISGLGCFFYNQLPAMGLPIDLEPLALVHTAGAFLMLIFMVIHIYMTTTGGTVWSYTLAMITGWEEAEDKQEV